MISQPTLDLAVEVAKSSLSKKKVGAVLLNKNKVVTTGVNKDYKTHPLQAHFAELAGLGEKIYLHAEISALVKCKTDADTIIVARLGGHSQNEIRNAQPCKICQLALQEAGITNAYYTTDEGFTFMKVDTNV